MAGRSLEVQIMRLGENRDIVQLQKLLAKTNVKQLLAILKEKLGRNDCITFWNCLLAGFDTEDPDSMEKRFASVKCLLNGLLEVELSYTQTYDLITRLCLELPTFSSVQLIEVLEHCIDSLRAGDPKCVGWKDLLPETLNVLAAKPKLNVNGVIMTGTEYRNTTVRNLFAMRCPAEVLTPLTDMFKNLNLSPGEITTLLNKFSGTLHALSPAELPTLAFQLFSISQNASHIIIPIMALEKYFHHYYYKKLFADMNSNSTDWDSIDTYSDKELREAEETILHHLNYCTQYKITELQMCAVLKNFQCMPDAILTPFVLSSILSMSVANREPNSRLSASFLLPFLRSVIKSNEDERKLADYSVWCRDSLHRKNADLAQIFTVLIDQNKEGKDVVTPGLVNMVFLLLKTKNNKHLNDLAISFLTKFIRKRFIFGKGLIKKLAQWMVVEQDQNQYSECLTVLSVADTFTVSECLVTIKNVMEYFHSIPGEQAMRMMSFILPILKISGLVRDAFIEVLRKAICSSAVGTRRMAVYGFCMVLKQLNHNNSQRSQQSASGFCTQQTLSGYSILSQAILSNRSNPQRHFDMLTLDIIGFLRRCFDQNLEIKLTLYENLQRAVELNPKLVPHVLQFIDFHFRSFFHQEQNDDDEDETELSIKYEKLVFSSTLQEQDIEVKDSLGSLTLFVSHCLEIFDRTEETEYDTNGMQQLLDLSVERVITKKLRFEEMTGSLTHYKSEMVTQQLHFIESLMAYILLTSKRIDDKIQKLLPLFKEHAKLYEGWKRLKSKKGQKKAKNPNDTEMVTNVTINGVPVKKIKTQIDNVWDLAVVERMLRLLHEDIVPFALPQQTANLRSNVELVRYVLEVTSHKIEAIRLEPEYKQLSHSKRTLKYLTDITKVIYERCIKRLPCFWNDFDMKSAALAAECFQQCLLTADAVYKSKFNETFVAGFDFHTLTQKKSAPAVLHDVIDAYMKENNDTGSNDDTDGRKIPQALLYALEVFYDNLSYGNRMTTESYVWLLNFCKQHEVKMKELSLVHKLLFTQRQKTHSGAFFNTIALHLGKILGRLEEDEEYKHPTQMSFELKSITLVTADSCLNYLYASLRKQIEDIEYFIMKANNMSYKYRLVPEDDRDICQTNLSSLERSICSQLVHVANALLILTDVYIPLGASMDGLLRLVMQLYVCLKNLVRHFQTCSTTSTESIKRSKFDALLHVVGKPLPTNIYNVIIYIEGNILEEPKGKRIKSDGQADKAKILRETKLIPKVILCLENFSKNVILLSKKINDRLSNFLHLGTVRDFRVKTSELKAAIDRTLSHSSQIEDGSQERESDVDNDDDGSDETNLNEDVIPQQEQRTEEDNCLERIETEVSRHTDTENSENENSEDYDSDITTMSRLSSKPTTSAQAKAKAQAKAAAKATEKTATKAVSKPNRKRQREKNNDEVDRSCTPEDPKLLRNESDRYSMTQLNKNLDNFNKQAKKRTLKEAENNMADRTDAAPPEAKRRRGRSAKD